MAAAILGTVRRALAGALFWGGDSVKWASAISEQSALLQAIAECKKEINRQLGPDVKPDLVVIFASAAHAGALYQIPTNLQRIYPDAIVMGCSGSGVIGDGREVEDSPGLSMVAAHLPGVVLSSFHIAPDRLPSPDASPDEWIARVGVDPAQSPDFLLLADPFSMAVDQMVEGLDYAFPGSAKIGGLASGARRPGELSLFINGHAERNGAVGIALSGNVIVDTVVAQGCRPVGRPMRVTKADRNLLMELDDAPPLQVLQEMYEHLPTGDQELVQHSLFLGLAMDSLQEDVGPGDFLIRNVVGADPQKGVISIGAMLQEGQTVQFHVRDAESSAQELQDRLHDYQNVVRGPSPEGALLFSCTGRGQYLYGRPDHDSELFRGAVGPLPMAGFFCSGEIGPVSGSTYLHAYTSSFAVIRPRTAVD
jgi:small ligand-binding sensory domain FIST